MPQARCAHCRTEIADRSTLVEMDGDTYCCVNCQMMAQEQPYTRTEHGICAHCETPIFDPRTRVERNGQFFCCNNCARAMVRA